MVIGFPGKTRAGQIFTGTVGELEWGCVECAPGTGALKKRKTLCVEGKGRDADTRWALSQRWSLGF